MSHHPEAQVVMLRISISAAGAWGWCKQNSDLGGKIWGIASVCQHDWRIPGALDVDAANSMSLPQAPNFGTEKRHIKTCTSG
jgi:hypothetical protein